MLRFDNRGNLTPYGVVPATIAELRSHFVEGIPSDTRAQLFEKYVVYSSELKRLSGGKHLRQWINGSFITKKSDPGDIDIITFLERSQVRKLDKLIENFRRQNSILLFGVDAYIVEVHPPGDKWEQKTTSDTAYWYDLFQKTRRNRAGNVYKKGFLEVFY